MKTINIKINSDLPLSVGLGSSAAYSLIMAAGIQLGMKYALEVIIEDHEFRKESNKIEEIQTNAQFLEDLLHDYN